MNKKFEYVDDNPGAYFGMLVEGFEDKEDKKELKENKSTKSKKLVEDLHTEKQIKLLQSRLSDFRKSWINLRDTLEYVDYEVASSIDDEYPFEMSFDELSLEVTDWLEDCIARCDWLYDEAQNGRFGNLTEDKDELSIVGEFETGEDFGQSAGTSKKNQAIFRAKALMKMKGLSRAKVVNAKGNVVWDSDTMLKEDKFVSRDKMSKKDRKELDSQKRNTWGNTNPVTRVQPNKKAYDRKRDKKVVEESFDNDVNVLVNLLSDKYCDEDGIVTKDSYDSIYKYLGKNYSEKIRDTVMDELVTEFGLPAERDKEVKLDEAKKGK